MSFGGPTRGVKSDINVTPLVDVVLVLLIIFMVLMPSMQNGKEVKLPQAKAGDENRKVDALTISVTSDRAVWFESRQLDPTALRAAVEATMRADPNRKILIKADESLKVKDVRRVMTEAHAAGAKGVSFAVEAVKR